MVLEKISVRNETFFNDASVIKTVFHYDLIIDRIFTQNLIVDCPN